MQNFANKVAIITGGASGIGRSLALQCARESMKIVIADIETGPLQAFEAELRAMGVHVLAVQTDVSQADSVENLAEQAVRTFGSVDLLFNNAGVSIESHIWESTVQDWEWILGVNLWGVIHGIRSFVPRMLKQGTDCHIVNTASLAGFASGPGLGAYKATKHAVVSISETLACELQEIQAQINVSVLCPYWVKTKIVSSGRNRPQQLSETVDMDAVTDKVRQRIVGMTRFVRVGADPDEVARFAMNGILAGRFYLMPSPMSDSAVRGRMDAILQRDRPLNAPL